jgi:urease accessory protein
MRRAIAVAPAGTWPREAALARITLAFEERYRRRFRMIDDGGEPFLLDLPRATVLADGDGLVIEGDGYILVCAAQEAVVDIRGRTTAEVAQLAWHIGNRHVPVQILSDGTIRMRDDHVLVAMIEGRGVAVMRLRAPFSPERGAYAPGAGEEASVDRNHADVYSHGPY